jgi:uncharacterized membrane protein AbrB (regulator of aidB expression)
MTIFQKTGNPYALIPLFVLFYVLGAGIVLHDFYAFPSPTVLIGIIAAFFCSSLPQMSSNHCYCGEK